MLTFKSNAAKTTHAAQCGSVRVGYVEAGREPNRWLWSLNTIQPKGGRAAGIVESEEAAKAALQEAWQTWLDNAGLEQKR